MPGSNDQQVTVSPVGTKAVGNGADELSQRTLQGVVWQTVQTIGTKVLLLVTMVPLAWLLEPEEIALIGLAMTVATFALLIQQVGVREILIHRQHQDRRWSSPAVWLSGALGLTGGAVALVATPLAVLAWRSEEMWGLLPLIALMVPMHALGLVPEARLQARLQFRLVAIVSVGVAVGQVVLVLVLAYLGFGAYSFVIPLPLAAFCRSALLWWLAPVKVRPRPEVRRWRLMIGDTGTIFSTNLFYTLASQGDYLVLGVLMSQTSLGLYYMAFTLAMAPLQLFALNVTQVLFPALSGLQHDPLRQVRACERVIAMLCMIVVPMAFGMAAVADPLVRLFLDVDYHGAIPLVQILSLGMVMRCAGWPCAGLLQAQGRFRTRLVLAIVWATSLLTMVFVAAWFWGTITHAAIAVAVHYTIVGPVTMYVTLRPFGVGWADVFRTVLPSVVAGGAAVGGAWLVGQLVAGSWPELSQLAVVVPLAILLYMPLMFVADRRSALELLQQGRTYFENLLRRESTAK